MSFSQWIFSTIIFMQQYTHTVLRSANKFFLGSFDTICSLHGYMRVLLMSYFHVHTSVTDDLCYLITTWRYTAFAQRKACLSAFETRRSTSITAANAGQSMQPMQLLGSAILGTPRHGVWAGCSFQPDTPNVREFNSRKCLWIRDGTVQDFSGPDRP